jgi:hypothetical protein
MYADTAPRRVLVHEVVPVGAVDAPKAASASFTGTGVPATLSIRDRADKGSIWGKGRMLVGRYAIHILSKSRCRASMRARPETIRFDLFYYASMTDCP